MELWDAFDADGAPVGRTLMRGEPIPSGLYHLVVSALIRHRDGDFLLMWRDASKPNFPSVWEGSAGGSALAGESAEQAIAREVAEETGIRDGAFTLLARERGVCQLYVNYLCVTACDKTAIALQVGETSAYRWVSPEALRAYRWVSTSRLYSAKGLDERAVVMSDGARAYLARALGGETHQ